MQQRCEFSLGQPALNSCLAYAITKSLKVGDGQPAQTRVFLRRDYDCLITGLAAMTRSEDRSFLIFAV